MHVVMFSRFPADIDQPKGGVESATVGLARGLAAQDGISVDVVTLEKDRSDDTVESMGGVGVHRLAGKSVPQLLDVFGGPGRKRIDEYIRRLKPDVVHFQETYGFGGPYSDIPTVFTVHGFDSLNLVTERKYLWQLRAPLWRFAERKGIRSHRYIVSIAPYVTESLREFYDGELVDIPNAISPEFFDVKPSPVAGRVFFAGWINARKNIMGAIAACNKLIQQGKDVTLHAAGDFKDEDYTRKTREIIAELGVEDRVRLLGRIDHASLRRELSEASVFILPSLQENAPMAIAEAMAAGVPVVTSNVCGMPTMIDEGENGFLVEPRDHGLIADRLWMLLGDPERQSRMGSIARRMAQDTYHPQAVVEATVNLYRRMIAEQGR